MAATTVLTATSAGLDLFSGIMGMSAADAQRASLRSQAQLLQTESEADIARYSRETTAFKAEQAVKYLKSGVALSGSPLEILDETTRVASENISAMRARAAAQGQALRTKGGEIAAASRVDFLRSVAGASATTLKTGKDLGWWAKKSSVSSESSYRPSRTSKQGSGGKLDLGFGY